MLITCPQCGCKTEKASGAVNRSRRQGLPVYCGRVCSGIASRIERTDDEKRAIKAAYDRQRRADLGEALLAEKREAYRRRVETDPEPLRAMQKALRAKRREVHAEYIRSPRYRKWKAEYDRKYHSRKQFGPFGEAAIILNQLEAEITSRASWIEIRTANGILNKKQTRRREYDRQTQRR